MSPQQIALDLGFFLFNINATYSLSSSELFITCATISKKDWWFLLMCIFPALRV